MKKLYRLMIIIGLIATHLYTTAQDRFERRYPIIQSNVVTSSLAAAGGGYAFIGVEVNTDGERENVNLVFLDAKGTISNSRSIYYGDDVEVKDAGQIIRLTDGTYVFSAVLDKDSLNKVITRVDNLGNEFWTVITGQISDDKDLSSDPSTVVEVPEERIFHAHTIGSDDGTTDIQLTGVDYFGEVEFVRKISYNTDANSTLNERFVKMHLAQDSSLMVLGTTDDPTAPFFLTSMDTSGNVLWTRSYNGDFGRVLGTEGYDMIQMVDGTWVILGPVLPTSTERNEGFLMIIDQQGNPLRTEAIRPTSVRYQLYPNGVVGMLDTTVVVSMKSLDMINNVYNPLIFNYDLDSLISYQTLLDTCISEGQEISGLVTLDSMSASFMTTTEKDDFEIPYLAKIDSDGTTFCEESGQLIVIDSVDFIGGEITFNSEEMMIPEDSIVVEVRAFGRYSPPILSVQDTVFCPEDPIDYTVDATVRGGVAYIWEDMSTDPVRRFTEEGMFMVTVTVAEDLCFMLCDTLTITQLDFPMVTIGKNFGNFCTSGEGFLNAEITGASIESFMWSTGSTDAFIIVDGTPMEYGVTVTDGCGNVAMATTAVSESDYLQPNPLGLVVGRDNLCVDGTLTITSTMQTDPSLITWSTGETNTLTINVDGPGTYSADVSGFCPDSESINLTNDDFVQPIEAEITFDCGDPGILNILGTGFVSQTWSTGETTPTITIATPDTYSVVLTDECGDEETREIIVTTEDIDGCTSCDSPCLIWPNAFQPASGPAENRMFGPKVLNRCNDGLASYELQIFNRWGKNIFTSNDVSVPWNGAIDGDPQPGGVYYYWSRYNDGTTTCERRGDLTLLR